ncbi:hypothetical protein GJ744_009628 [Endocarpon pusillum]|uniref:Amidoligase enzyme n=1 Tax=Endocarpon pusillum TaxID=364733 RepID=A0A8H7E5Z3_9EURO|nr:hypothetical protein GJ744_009628 [Endocarpon pusillum]
MAGDSDQNSGDSDTGSLERFRRSQRRRLSSPEQNPPRLGGSGIVDGCLPRRSQCATGEPALPCALPTRRAEAATTSTSAIEASPGAGSSKRPSQSQFRHLRLGIETEFLLAARNPDHNRPRLDHFAEVLAANYNAHIDRSRRHPRMNSTLLAPNDPDDNKKWSMVYESTNWRDKSPWGIEMRSPILDVFPHSAWRAHVIKTWGYLDKHYKILGDDRCSTHIHVSMIPKYNLADLKHIASTIIHFEEAFEALMPDHRRGNGFAASNWLCSPYLRRQGKNRLQSIEAIRKANDEVEVFRLIQGLDNNNFCWNFLTVFGDKGTIEFRQPPASIRVADVLGWAELVMNFIQASLLFGSSAHIFPANVGGLRSFIEQVNVDGVNKPDWLRHIWEGKRKDMAFRPKQIHPERLSKWDSTQQLTEKIVAELRSSRMRQNLVYKANS